MYKILGYTRNSGVFNAGTENVKEWYNYDIHCSYTPANVPENLYGDTVKSIRVSSKVFQNFSNEVNGNIIGSTVNFEFEIKAYNGVEKIVTTDIIPLE